MKRLLILFCGMIASATPVFSAEDARGLIEQKLKAFAPGLQINSIGKAPIDGFYEVVVGTRILYFSHDAKYMFLGELLDADSKVNLTEMRRASLTAERLDGYGKDRMIVIGPQVPKRFITVFTDVDCPYCAKFHRDVPTLNAAGVEVRYLLFPRTGIGSESYHRAVGVWCSKDPIVAVGIAKAGGNVEFQDCDNPVDEHYSLGQEVGINGTPAIVLDDGQVIAGYLPPEQLINRLDLSGQQ